MSRVPRGPFKTQMQSRGVDSDYVDHMMGHVVDIYHDIKSKGVEFLGDVHTRAGLVARTRPKLTKLEVMKELARARRLDPEKILVQEAFAEPTMAKLIQKS